MSNFADNVCVKFANEKLPPMNENTTDAEFMTDGPANLLRQAGLRQTSCRLELLQALYGRSEPVPLASIEERLVGFDRVTIYRTLQSFLQAGLVHRANDSGGHPHYAPGGVQGGRRSHAHFECQQCGRMLCFDCEQPPVLRLPPGFETEETELRVRGLCDRCNVS